MKICTRCKTWSRRMSRADFEVVTTQIVDSYIENKISYSEIESCSDDHLLQLFHGKSDNSLGNWFGLKHAWQGPLRGDRREHAWLLGEGVVLLRAGRAGFFLSFDLKVFEDRNGFIAAVSWSKKAFSLSRREVASTASLSRNCKNLASKPYFQGLSTILLTLILKTKFLVPC